MCRENNAPMCRESYGLGYSYRNGMILMRMIENESGVGCVMSVLERTLPNILPKLHIILGSWLGHVVNAIMG